MFLPLQSKGQREGLFHLLYRFGLVFKGLDGVLETVLGGVLFFVKPSTIQDWIDFFSSSELAEDPHDRLARILLSMAQHLTLDTKLFDALYLSSHGLIKLVLCAALWFERRWIYPFAIGFLGLLIGIELYRLTYRFSAALSLFIFLDFLFILLIRWEYRKGFPRGRLRAGQAAARP